MCDIENHMVIGDYYEDEKPVLSCDECDEGIYPGEQYYELFDTVLCETCFDRLKYEQWSRTAEVD